MPKLAELLPNKLTSNKVWKDFADTVEAVLQANVWSPAGAILGLRDPEAVEEEFSGLLSSLLGFNNATSQLLDAGAHRRVNEALYQYYKSKNKSLDRLLSYVVNGKLVITPLWTRDYVNFYSRPNGSTIYVGGEWYYTPHVEIVVAAEDALRIDSWITTSGMLGTSESLLGSLSLGSVGGATSLTFTELFNPSTVAAVFYEFAPIHLILEKIALISVFRGTAYVSAALRTSVYPSTAVPPPQLFVLGGVRERVYR